MRVSRPVRWEEEELFTTGDEYFARLLLAIERAHHSIELETYIFEKGKLAERMLLALMLAARRGVRVRLIVDGWGSPAFVHDYWPRLKSAGVRERFFRVNPWIMRRLPGDPRGFIYRMFYRLRYVNRGIHRKSCLLDNSELWVGSFNISDVHLQEVYGNEAWKDMGVRVRGAEIKYAKRAFSARISRLAGWPQFSRP